MTAVWLIVALVAAIGVAAFLAYRLGKKSQTIKHNEQRLNDVKDAKEVRDNVGRIPIDDTVDRLSKWRR